MPSKFQICSQASVLVGGQPIAAFDQASTEAILAEQLYEDVVLDLLASYRWRFASRIVDCSEIEDGTETDDFYSAAYQLPAGTTVIHAVRSDHRNIRFDIIGDRIRTDQGGIAVSALVGFRPNEGDFPPYFVTCLKLKLAAMFAIPIAEDPVKANVYEGQFVRAFAQARSIESQGRTTSKVAVGGLRRIHGGRA